MMSSVPRTLALFAALLVVMTATTEAFSVSPSALTALSRSSTRTTLTAKKIADKRRKQLGIADDEDEYDLDLALDNNTDPFITKVIAGSLILSITALLIYAIVIPATTDYGEGVCNALLTGGRC